MVNPVPGADELEGDGGARVLAALAATAGDVPVGVSDPRREGDPLVWVNAAFTRLTGWSSAQARTRSWRSLAGEGPDPAVLAALADLDGVPAREPVRVLLRGAGVPWAELVLTPVLDESGRAVHHVGVLQDVGARVAAERAAEAARSRLSVLADVTDALAVPEALAAAARLVEVLARSVPWAAVVLARGDLRLASAATAPGGPGEASTAAPDGAGPPALPSLPLAQVAAAEADPLADLLLGRRRAPVDVGLGAPDEPGRPVVAGWLAGALADAGVTGGASGAGDDRAVVVPVPGADAVLGLLVLGQATASVSAPVLRRTAEPGGAGVTDRAGGADGADGLDGDAGLAVEVARLLGHCLESAGLHERQRLLAGALQRSLLPELPSVPGLDVWSHHLTGPRTGDDLAQVGGDWFDVLQPGGEGSGVVGVVVGDVGGHDVEAAAAMGQLRSVVRASAHDREDPGTVLARVDQLVTGMRVRRPASLLYARLEDLGDGAWEMSWSRAGHLPPVLVQAGRARSLGGGAGEGVGVGDRPRPTGIVELGPGDAVVLCTDGLLGRRSRPSDEGVDALVAACTEVAGTDAAGTGEHLLSQLADTPEDDLALLVVRVPGAAAPRPGPRRRRWQLPGEAASVARARRRAAAVGALWGLPTTAQAELVVSELVANAVLHGGGTVGLRITHDDDGLLVEVEDSSPEPPGVLADRREGPGGYGLHVVQRLSQWGWRPGPAGKTVWARLPDAG